MAIDLSVKLGPLHLKNPILVASGTFGYGREFAELIDLNRLGALVTKTITLEPRPGNPPPRIVETAAGMLNSIGLANVGVDAFIKEKLPYLQQFDTALIVNIAGRSSDEFERTLASLEDCGMRIDAYELNYSCPNVREGGLAFSADAGVAHALTARLRGMTARPLIAKLTPNVTSIASIAAAVKDAGADAVSAINTLVGMAVDVTHRKPLLATVKGGLSGPAIKPVALAKVWEIHQAVDIPIIGVGGIMCCRDVLEFLIVGAAAVEIGTANFVEPAASMHILDDLESYCSEHGIPAIREITGTLDK